MSHIEVILSFAIFLGAVLFIFYLFNPIHEKKADKLSLDELLEEIKNHSSVDVTAYWVKINNTNNQITPPNKIAINLSFVNKDNLNVSVKDLSGEILKSHINDIDFGNGTACIKKGAVAGSDLPPFIFITIGEGFNNAGNDNAECPSGTTAVINESYYQVSSSYKRTILSERKLLELNKTYYSNYANLKNRFSILNANNFDFAVAFSSTDLIKVERTIPGGVEIKAINKRMEVLRENGDIQFADILLRIW